MRNNDPQKASRYLTKSEEFLEMAKLAAQNANYNSTVTCAIHSAISALDALTTSYKGKRGSDNHAEALTLVQGIFTPPRVYRNQKAVYLSNQQKERSRVSTGLDEAKRCSRISNVGRKNRCQSQKETRVTAARCLPHSLGSYISTHGGPPATCAGSGVNLVFVN